MKKSFFTLLFSLMVLFSTAQETTFSQGDKVINFGIGLGNVLYSGTGYKTVIPPLSASFEYGIADGIADVGSIGIGGYIGYTSAKYEITDPWGTGETYGWDYSSLIIGARGSFHYPFVDNLDTYGGVMLGYNVVQAKEFGTSMGLGSASASGIAYSLYIGARYYFTPNIAAMAEVGYGIAYLNLGIAFKF